ncbi:GAF domain-containing sensor histidine kinase, partial [Pseudodesulfovibrio sp.]|nr:GAF domain-containing sensor histidine kinase [Pseudodesulfovibrio sp.]
MVIKEKIHRAMKKDERKTKSELLYELRLQRLENLRLLERLGQDQENFSDRHQLKYLENTALIDQAIRQTTDLDEMMNSLMDVLRAIFECDQAWLLHPCDPDAPSWRLPFRSVSPKHPIHFGPDDDLPATPDLAENCRLALGSLEAVPLDNTVKDVPKEAQESAAKSGLLIALHPKVGRPWLMGLHQCSTARTWTAEEKRMFQDISGRIADALSATLFYQNLEQNQERLKHLSTQLFRAQEEERKRVAEEIHDELGQAALAIKMGVENALFLMDDTAPESMQRSLQSASNLAKNMVDTMRRMQTSLYPPTLRDFGAITALNGLLNDFTNIYSSISVKRKIHIVEDDIPDKLRVTVFRLAQETLYNAAKHSQADTIIVILDRIGCRLFLEVVDDGIGFNPATTIRYPDNRLGLGLTSMRERAEMTDGTMEIDSRPGRGATFRFLWDLPTD